MNQYSLYAGQFLRAGRAGGRGEPHPVPGHGGAGGGEAVRPDGRRGVRHPQEHLDGLQVASGVHGLHEPLELAVPCLYYPGQGVTCNKYD